MTPLLQRVLIVIEFVRGSVHGESAGCSFRDVGFGF